MSDFFSPGEHHPGSYNRFWMIVFLAMSLLFLCASLVGMLHTWHKFLFLSLSWLDHSYEGALVSFMLTIACWMAASCFSWE